MKFAIIVFLIAIWVACSFQYLHAIPSKNTRNTSPTILGIDFGSEFIKVAYASRGKPIDLLLNEQSKRKTSNFVGFRRVNERLIGENARQVTARFPSAAVRYYYQMFLGKRFSLAQESLNLRCKNELGLTSWEWKENEARKTIDLVLRGDDNISQVFQPEELVAYMLRYVVGFLDPNTQHLSGVVISVPPYFTLEQREAILSAAKLADIPVLGLLSETAALAIQYGSTRFSKLKEQQKHNVIIFDMGATTISASVIQYNDNTSDSKKDPLKLGSFKILSTKWRKDLGGEDFTRRLSQHIVSKFKETHNIDISQNDRVMERVLSFAKKAKEVLTANSDTEVYIESIYNDIDFKLKITRQEFDEMIEGLIGKILDPVREALQESKLSLNDIESFDVVGGGARVMAVQEKLNRFFKKGVSHTLNGDESIAIGSVLFGASQSPLFRVRSFEFEDYNPFGIEFILSASGQNPEKVYSLFKVKDHINLLRYVNIPRQEDFTITLKYDENSRPEDVPENGWIYRYNFKNVNKAMSKFTEVLANDKEATAKVRIGYELTRDGLIRLDSAEAILEQFVDVEIPSTSNDTTVEKITKKEKRITKEKVDVEIDYFTIPQITEPDTFTKLKERMQHFEKLELERKIIAHARNDLEATFYNTQSTLYDDEFLPYFLQNEIDSLKILLEKLDDWLSSTENDDTITAKNYNEKNNEILNIILPVKERKEEDSKRNEKIDSCQFTFKKIRKSVEELSKIAPHITDEDKQTLLEVVASTEAWLSEKIEKQKSIPLNEPPIFTISEIDTECNKLNRLFNVLASKPNIKIPEQTQKETSPNSTETKSNTDTPINESNTDNSSESQQSTESQDPSKDEL